MNFINWKTNKQKMLILISDGNWRAKNAPKLFPKQLNDRICKIKQYLNYILMIIHKNTLSNSKDIIKSAKNFMKNFTPRRQLPKLLLSSFLSKIPNRKKRRNERFKLSKAKISLNDVIKSINSHTNNKFPGNNDLTAEFYIYFLNKLALVLSDAYDSWGKLGTMGVTSRTGIIFAIYKKRY